MSLTTRNGIWCVRSRADGDRLVSLGTRDRMEAERLAIVIMGGKPLPPKLKELWAEYEGSPMGKALTASSMASKRLIWNSFALNPDVRSDAIDVRTAAEYLFEVAARASNATAKKHRANLSSIWQAVGWKWALVNPWPSTPPLPSEKADSFRPYTKQELSAIEASASNAHPEWSGLIAVAKVTGLRLKDAVSLTGAMARDGYISLVPAKTHRKGRMVRIPIHSSIAKLFSRNGQLFPYLSSRYAKDRGSLSREFRAILDDAGIPKDGTGFHSLRATFITSLEQAGVDRSLVQGMVGHTSPMQTAHYSRVVATQAQIERLQV